MAQKEHEITLTWTDPNMNRGTITDAIDNILQMGDIDQYEIAWEQSQSKIQFQNEKDKNFLKKYKHKLQKMGYIIQWKEPQDTKSDHDEDDDDDIDLHGITAGGPGDNIPQINTQKETENILVKHLNDININDLVEINSEPDDDDDDTNLHIHRGYITKKTKEQITIKEDNGDCNYFFDEVNIILIRKNSKANQESKQDIKPIKKLNIEKQPLQESKENVKTDIKSHENPIEKPIEQHLSLPTEQNAYFNENKNDNGTPELAEPKDEIKEKPLELDAFGFSNDSNNSNNIIEKPLDLVHNDKPITKFSNDEVNKLLDLAENDNNSDSETENYNNKALGLDSINVPSLHARNDSLFAHFGKRDIKRELEQEDSAVISAFGSDNNKNLISKSHTNLFPNITAPLQSVNINKFNPKPMGMIPAPNAITQAFSHGPLAGGNAQKRVDTQFKCNICHKYISASDWTNNNVEQIQIGTKWQHSYCKSYVSLNSQYSLGSISSCTINALEAAMQLQMRQKVSVKLIDKILELSSLYKEDKHTCVEDVFPYVKRYFNNLNKVKEYLNKDIKDLKNIINKQLIPGISAIITKPPESVFIHNKEHQIIIYDSHPRSKQLNGSHFLVFNNKLLALKYLSKMWPYQYLGKQFNDLRAQQINMCDITLFKLKRNVNPSLIPDKKQMGIELKKIGVTLQQKWYKTYGNDNESKFENDIDEKNLDEKTINYIHKLEEENSKLRDKIGKLEETNSKLKNENYTLKSCMNPQPPNVLITKAKTEVISAIFTCKKCHKRCKMDDKFIFTDCKCETCRNCAKKYLEHQLNKKRWPIMCFICNIRACHPIDFQMFEMHEKYCQLSQSQLLKKEVLKCPNCQKQLTVKEWNKNKKRNETGEHYTCPKRNCKFKFCVKCGLQYDGIHYKISCADALKIANQAKTVGKCANCFKLLVNKAGNKQKLYIDDVIVFCKNCKQYNCFKCGKISDKKRETVKRHVIKQHLRQ